MFLLTRPTSRTSALTYQVYRQVSRGCCFPLVCSQCDMGDHVHVWCCCCVHVRLPPLTSPMYQYIGGDSLCTKTLLVEVHVVVRACHQKCAYAIIGCISDKTRNRHGLTGLYHGDVTNTPILWSFSITRSRFLLLHVYTLVVLPCFWLFYMTSCAIFIHLAICMLSSDVICAGVILLSVPLIVSSPMIQTQTKLWICSAYCLQSHSPSLWDVWW